MADKSVLTEEQLESLVPVLQAALGNYWRFYLVAREDEDNYFDPPCTHVRAELWNLVDFCFCDDGEVFCNKRTPYFVVDTSHADWRQAMVNGLINVLKKGGGEKNEREI